MTRGIMALWICVAAMIAILMWTYGNDLFAHLSELATIESFLEGQK